MKRSQIISLITMGLTLLISQLEGIAMRDEIKEEIEQLRLEDKEEG